MATHNIPRALTDAVIAGPSKTKRDQAVNLQQFIQGLFGDGYHTFLQGSYRNHTAISDLPDIDIVVVRTGTYSGTHSPYAGGRPTIQWEEIFNDIEEKLRNQRTYTWDMERKEKCVMLKGSLDADVIPAVKYHHDHLADPIVIRSFTTVESPSYPRTHINNGEAKNTATNANYKPTVRMFKRWADNHFGDSDVVSSHKIESLVHATTNDNFFEDPALSFLWVGSKILERLVEAYSNGVPSVCGTENILDTWDSSNRLTFSGQLGRSFASVLAAYKSSTSTEAERLWRAGFNM